MVVCVRFFVLSDMSSPYFNRDSRIEFTQLRTLLLLAKKYDIPHLAEPAIHRLRKIYPSSTLASFDAVSDLDEGPVEMTYRDHLAAIDLARRCDLPDIVPVACYRYLVSPREIDFESILSGLYYGNTHVHLSSEDTNLLLSGKERLLVLTQKVLESIWDNKSAEDRRRQYYTLSCKCLDKFGSFATKVYTQGSPRMHAGLTKIDGDLEELDDTSKKTIQEKCMFCGRNVMQRYNAHREKMWTELGPCFGVDQWPKV